MKAALWKLNWPTLIFNISGRAGLMSDNVVIGWALGPAMVVPFYLTQRLAALVQLQLQGIGNGTWAGLVELHAQGETATFHARLLELTGLVSGIGIAVLGPVAAYNSQFVRHWVGSDRYSGDTITLLACLNAWLCAIFSFWNWPLTGTGKIGAWAPYSVIFVGINVTVSIAGALRFGLVGPLIGTLVACLSVNLWALPMVLERSFGTSARALLAAAAKPLLFGLPYAVLLWLVAHSHTASGWPGLLAEMGAAAVGGIGVWFFLTVPRNDRKIWLARFRSLLFPERSNAKNGVAAG
jgi:O-antigen/teichoic acid export membrane protein